MEIKIPGRDFCSICGDKSHLDEFHIVEVYDPKRMEKVEEDLAKEVLRLEKRIEKLEEKVK